MEFLRGRAPGDTLFDRFERQPKFAECPAGANESGISFDVFRSQTQNPVPACVSEIQFATMEIYPSQCPLRLDLPRFQNYRTFQDFNGIIEALLRYKGPCQRHEGGNRFPDAERFLQVDN